MNFLDRLKELNNDNGQEAGLKPLNPNLKWNEQLWRQGLLTQEGLGTVILKSNKVSAAIGAFAAMYGELAGVLVLANKDGFSISDVTDPILPCVALGALVGGGVRLVPVAGRVFRNIRRGAF